MAPRKKTTTTRKTRTRGADGKFLPGIVTNQKGRPVGAKNKLTKDFHIALEVVETAKGKSLLQHCIEQAYTDNKMAIAIIKKIVPDLKQIDARIEATIDGKVSITTNLDIDKKLIQGLPNPPQLDEESK
jgi:hypothetical protein